MKTLLFVATHPAETPLPDWLLITLLILGGIVWAAGYAVACRLWPFTVCNRCQGSDKRFSPSGKMFGDCRRCKGTGRQLRTGRRLLNWLYRTKDAMR